MHSLNFFLTEDKELRLQINRNDYKESYYIISEPEKYTVDKVDPKIHHYDALFREYQKQKVPVDISTDNATFLLIRHTNSYIKLVLKASSKTLLKKILDEYPNQLKKEALKKEALEAKYKSVLEDTALQELDIKRSDPDYNEKYEIESYARAYDPFYQEQPYNLLPGLSYIHLIGNEKFILELEGKSTTYKFETPGSYEVDERNPNILHAGAYNVENNSYVVITTDLATFYQIDNKDNYLKLFLSPEVKKTLSRLKTLQAAREDLARKKENPYEIAFTEDNPKGIPVYSIESYAIAKGPSFDETGRKKANDKSGVAFTKAEFQLYLDDKKLVYVIRNIGTYEVDKVDPSIHHYEANIAGSDTVVDISTDNDTFYKIDYKDYYIKLWVD